MNCLQLHFIYESRRFKVEFILSLLMSHVAFMWLYSVVVSSNTVVFVPVVRGQLQIEKFITRHPVKRKGLSVVHGVKYYMYSVYS